MASKKNTPVRSIYCLYASSVVHLITDTDVGEWIKRHHRISKDASTATQYHVFAAVGPIPTKPEERDTWEVDISVPIGPINLQVCLD